MHIASKVSRRWAARRAVGPVTARATLAATDTLGGTAYTAAIGSDEVQAALETVNGHASGDDPGRDLTPEDAAGIEAIATELDPRTEDEIHTAEADAA